MCPLTVHLKAQGKKYKKFSMSQVFTRYDVLLVVDMEEDAGRDSG
jgi:hypothetical protein